MKIILNGVYFGGNCPIFYKVLKDLGHDVKVYDVLFINSYNEFSDLINEEDLIIPKYSFFIFLKLRLYRKFFKKKWINILVKKVNDFIIDFKPDVIFNHQISIRSNVMLKTKFKPQFNFVYGSEIKQKNKTNSDLKFAIENAEYTFVPSLEAQNILLNYFPDLSNKLCLSTTNFIYPDKLMKTYLNCDIVKIRNDYNYLKDDFIIYDNRSLRNIDLSLNLVKAIKLLKDSSYNCKIILVKGYSGSAQVIEVIKDKISDWKLTNHISIIDESITDKSHYELLALSDAYCSILKADEFGSGIAQAMYFKKLLLLSDLEVYKQYIKNNAVYVNKLNYKDISDSIINLINKNYKIDFKYNYDLVDKKFNALTNIEFILNKVKK
tara:strand:- start:26303 stop:27439 length:1137 start_codon:yes stop_codon:yes gene_type:complete